MNDLFEVPEQPPGTVTVTLHADVHAALLAAANREVISGTEALNRAVAAYLSREPGLPAEFGRRFAR